MSVNEPLRPSFEADETGFNDFFLSIPEGRFGEATDTPTALGAAAMLGVKRDVIATVADTRLDFDSIVSDLD